MKILLVHNFYGSAAPSGENLAFRLEEDLLRSNGATVERFTRNSDDIRSKGVVGMVKGGLSTPWNPWAAAQIRKKVESFHPDIVHVHNTFPLLSPAIFHGVGTRAAKVLTLHNYRLFCAAGIPLREGRICTDCISSRSALPGLLHGCYRGSRLATLPLAASVGLHRVVGTWRKKVDAFIALSDFQRTLMAESGLPLERTFVKPNFFPGKPAVKDWNGREEGAVFVGRLTPEKGVLTLIEAWRIWGDTAPPLKIIGEGPLKPELMEAASRLPAGRVTFLGQVPPETAQEHISRSRLLLLPSEWFEGFPMVVREAFAFGTPVAATDVGPLPKIVESGVSGLIFGIADPQSLHQVVSEAWKEPGRLKQLGEGARREFDLKYTEEANYRQLTHIYEQAVMNNQRNRGK